MEMSSVEATGEGGGGELLSWKKLCHLWAGKSGVCDKYIVSPRITLGIRWKLWKPPILAPSQSHVNAINLKRETISGVSRVMALALSCSH